MTDKVILRRWRKQDGGDVIALFPELPADDHGQEVTSYMHVGQHSGASYWHVLALTDPVPVGDPEGMTLLDELRAIGYDPLPYRRRTYAMVKRCRAAAQEGA